MIELAARGESCQSTRRVHTRAPYEDCGRTAKWRVDGILVCWQHGLKLVEGREAELKALYAEEKAADEDRRLQRIADSTPGLVYVLQVYGATPAPLKIGFSTDLDTLDTRIRDLQCGNSNALEIVGLRAGTVGGEHEIHRQLRAHLIRGEWFWPRPDVMRAFVAGTVPLVRGGSAA